MVESILEKLRSTGTCTDDELDIVVNFGIKEKSILQRVLPNGVVVKVLEFVDDFYCNIEIGGKVYENVPYFTFLLWDFHKLGRSVKSCEMRVGYSRKAQYGGGVILRGNLGSFYNNCDVITDNNILLLNWTYDKLRFSKFASVTLRKFENTYRTLNLDLVQEGKLRCIGDEILIRSKSVGLKVLDFNEDLSKISLRYKDKEFCCSFEEVLDIHAGDKKLLEELSRGKKQSKDKENEATEVPTYTDEITIKEEHILDEGTIVIEQDFGSEPIISIEDVKLGGRYQLDSGEIAVVTAVVGDKLNCITYNGVLRTISVSSIIAEEE